MLKRRNSSVFCWNFCLGRPNDCNSLYDYILPVVVYLRRLVDVYGQAAIRYCFPFPSAEDFLLICCDRVAYFLCSAESQNVQHATDNRRIESIGAGPAVVEFVCSIRTVKIIRAIRSLPEWPAQEKNAAVRVPHRNVSSRCGSAPSFLEEKKMTELVSRWNLQCKTNRI